MSRRRINRLIDSGFMRLVRMLSVIVPALLAVILCLPPEACANPAASSAASPVSGSDLRRRVMVDYIVHFAHHLQWPIEVFSGKSAPFRVCVMGADTMLAPLKERLHLHRVQGRMVTLEKIHDGELIRARRCQIIVLDNMGREGLIGAVTALEFFPVLTVSSAERFAALGGMVEFAGSGTNMALQLNPTRLKRAELKIGSSLFKLGRKIQ